MSFLVCNKCGEYYELQDGESPDDFEKTCDCGGTLKFAEKLDGIKEESVYKKNLNKLILIPIIILVLSDFVWVFFYWPYSVFKIKSLSFIIISLIFLLFLLIY